MNAAAWWLAMLAILAVGSWFAAVIDALAHAVLARRPATAAVLVGPLQRAAAMLVQQSMLTEHPDRLNAVLAVALYLALAVAGIAVVPLAADHGLDMDAGIVLWGAVEAMTVVVVFLHGWSANAWLPLVGAYRYAGIGLPVILVSMFVLIGAALPAQSLSVVAIVESQGSVWNVVRQPLGLPLFLLLGLSLTFRGPFAYADSTDLAGGTSAESTGMPRALWAFARLAMLVSFAAMASAVFLGGYLGPWLPGPLWLVIKMALVLAVTIGLGNLVARLTPSRMLTLLWTVLLPVSFLDLVLAGLQALR